VLKRNLFNLFGYPIKPQKPAALRAPLKWALAKAAGIRYSRKTRELKVTADGQHTLMWHPIKKRLRTLTKAAAALWLLTVLSPCAVASTGCATMGDTCPHTQPSDKTDSHKGCAQAASHHCLDVDEGLPFAGFDMPPVVLSRLSFVPPTAPRALPAFDRAYFDSAPPFPLSIKKARLLL
jgi:hypothetical protein